MIPSRGAWRSRALLLAASAFSIVSPPPGRAQVTVAVNFAQRQDPPLVKKFAQTNASRRCRATNATSARSTNFTPSTFGWTSASERATPSAMAR